MTTKTAPGRKTLVLPSREASRIQTGDPEPQFDLAVFIARTQPPTTAHIQCVRRALQAGRRVVLLSGSSFQARSPRNFLYFSERAALIRGALEPEENERTDILPLPDCYSDTQWQIQVRKAVRDTALARGFGTRARICLVGHAKDATSYYLNMFPGWSSVETGGFNDISATTMRAPYLADGGIGAHEAVDRHASMLPANVQAFLHEFAHSAGFAWLMSEMDWQRQNRIAVAGVRYQPPIVTTEAVVVQSGHVLLARRIKRPGMDLFCLPSDLLREESFRQGALRVLVKDYRLMVTSTRNEAMAASLLGDKMGPTVVFDHPYRSERGHVVSGCHLVQLRGDRRGLAPLGEGTESQKPEWVPIDEVNPELMFEDRYHLMNQMLSHIRQDG